jgi:hypothetical protein
MHILMNFKIYDYSSNILLKYFDDKYIHVSYTIMLPTMCITDQKHKFTEDHAGQIMEARVHSIG